MDAPRNPRYRRAEPDAAANAARIQRRSSMWTPQFEVFVAPARRRPELWRLGVGTVLAFACYVAVTLLVVVTAAAAFELTAGPLAPVAALRSEAFLTGRTPTGVVALLFTFAGLGAGAMLAARWLHARPGRSLLGPGWTRDFVPAAAITLALGLGVAGVGLALGTGGELELVRNTPTAVFLSFLPAALVALAVQTGAEEVLFRGYLQTQLAARFRSPLAWMVVPSLLFGALHLDPTALLDTGRPAENDGYIFAATTLVGLLAADLTRVTGNLGAAWGLHFANNVQALLIVALDDMLSGLSLWKTPFGPEDTETLPLLLMQDMALLVVIWAAIRLWLARRGRG